MHPGICLLHIATEQENRILYMLRHIKKWKNNSVQ